MRERRQSASLLEGHRYCFSGDRAPSAADARRMWPLHKPTWLPPSHAVTRLKRRWLAIRAPRLGRILEVKLRAGEYCNLAAAGANPLVVTGDPRLSVRIDVDERDIAKVKQDASAYVIASAFRAKVAARVMEIGQADGGENVRTDDPTRPERRPKGSRRPYTQAPGSSSTTSDSSFTSPRSWLTTSASSCHDLRQLVHEPTQLVNDLRELLPRPPAARPRAPTARPRPPRAPTTTSDSSFKTSESS